MPRDITSRQHELIGRWDNVRADILSLVGAFRRAGFVVTAGTMARQIEETAHALDIDMQMYQEPERFMQLPLRDDRGIIVE